MEIVAPCSICLCSTLRVLLQTQNVHLRFSLIWLKHFCPKVSLRKI